MIETITPAGCGSRNRYRLALAAFAAGALVASALLGALLGLFGEAIGAGRAVLLVAAIAGLGAAREAGLARFSLPQVRRQVPERWHFELPLPLWSAGYGAGLGLGFLTFQPVATFWVAVAAALALGRPLAAAACFSLYGLGRALMVAVPRRPDRDVTGVVERLLARGTLVRRLNALALAACAVLLVAAPAAGAEDLPLGAGDELDPARSGRVVAYTKRASGVTSVVVRVSAQEEHTYPGRSPSLDGALLAYADGRSVRVIRWETGQEVARIADASRPALEWPRVVFRRDYPDGTKRLYVRNLQTGVRWRLAAARARVDIGRATIAAGRIAWHVAGRRGSAITVHLLADARKYTFRRSRIALLAYPSLSSRYVAWVEQYARRTYFRIRRFGASRTYTLAVSRRRDVRFWTTALAGRSAYVTRWNTRTPAAVIARSTF